MLNDIRDQATTKSKTSTGLFTLQISNHTRSYRFIFFFFQVSPDQIFGLLHLSIATLGFLIILI